MKTAKIISMALALFMLCSLTAACTFAPKTLMISDYLDPSRDDFAADGQSGFEFEVISAVADKIGYSVKYMDLDYYSSDKKGVSCISGLINDATLLSYYDFTEPYLEIRHVLVVRTEEANSYGDTPDELARQLEQKDIGTLLDSFGSAFIKGDANLGYTPIEGARVKSYDNLTNAAYDLSGKVIDAIILDRATAEMLVMLPEAENLLQIIDTPVVVESYGLAVYKGSSSLLKKLNNALTALKDEGKLESLAAECGISLFESSADLES